ncbi:2-oxo acid dehydrogenase subunit E2 [Candidatus Bathyarchaeota archaeon]|nr:2-oxo acid dehydrogenase subunit E2 [Candidatus Bathyarchaeota archaeon]
MVTKIVMPRLSLTMKTGTVIQWFKKEGETVEKGESIVEVLSEKVTYEVEAPESGVLRKIIVEEGMEIPVDAMLALIAKPDEDLNAIEIEIKPSLTELSKETIAVDTQPSKPSSAKKRIPASPAAKKIAKEHNVDLGCVAGTGPEGRILERNVEQYLEERVKTPRIREEIPLTGIRKVTAERVATSFHTAPHSFVIMEVDMTEATKIRDEANISYTAILVYSTAKALREFPVANSTLVDGKIRIYEDINVGVAVSTEKGLIVPVIWNADEKSLSRISSELKELVEKAREGNLSKEQLTGGTFTLTNLGMYNVDMFLPIINPPEAAILAAGRIVAKPVAAGGETRIKPTMTLTLGYDHRIIDGAPAAQFLKKAKESIEQLNCSN